MNVFAGARRVVLVLAAGGVLVGAGVAMKTEPYVVLNYVVRDPISPPEHVGECRTSAADGWQSLTRRSPEGKTYQVRLCFYAVASSDGSVQGIPFLDAGEEWLVHVRHDARVEQYMERYASNLKAHPSEHLIESRRRSEEHKAQLWDVAFGTLGWLLFLAVLTFVLGWIVRGFAGIPNGQDKKPALPPS